jgi:hypothetical protein
LTEEIIRDILKNNEESHMGEGIIYKMIVTDNGDGDGIGSSGFKLRPG